MKPFDMDGIAVKCDPHQRRTQTSTNNPFPKRRPIQTHRPKTEPELRREFDKRVERQLRAEEPGMKYSFFVTIRTCICYLILCLVGVINDMVRPKRAQEINRDGYVPLYPDTGFLSFFNRHIFRRIRDCWGTPVASVPGNNIVLMAQTTKDYGRTFVTTGRKIDCINLGSYNFLGFADNQSSCAETANNSIINQGVASTSSRMEMGNSHQLNELDEIVARFIGTEAALTFAMGFATDLLNTPAILNECCLILTDEKTNPAIIQSLRLSKAAIRKFKHNNMQSLEAGLRDGIKYGNPATKLPWEKIFIVVEGIYCVEGTILRLPEIINLKKKYKVYLCIDEAYSMGAIGGKGKGVVDYWYCDINDVDILMGTFSNSFASAGSYIAGSYELIEVLRRYSATQAYGTAMSPPIAQQIITSMRIIMGEDGTREGVEKIRNLARYKNYFRRRLKQAGFIVYGNDDSPIIPVATCLPTTTAYVIREMKGNGVAIDGLVYPDTSLLEGRIMFCISASHSFEKLDVSLQAMWEIGRLISLPSPSRLHRLVENFLNDEDLD